MMEINLQTILTLEDNEKYVVVARIEYRGSFYDYLLQLTENGEKIINRVAIVKEEREETELYIVEIKDKKELEVLLPLFQEQLEGQI